MSKHSALHWIAGIIFAIIAIVHLIRLIQGWAAVIAGWEVPLFVSGIAVVIAGILSFLLLASK